MRTSQAIFGAICCRYADTFINYHGKEGFLALARFGENRRKQHGGAARRKILPNFARSILAPAPAQSVILTLLTRRRISLS